MAEYSNHEDQERVAWDLRQSWARQVEWYEDKITKIDIPQRFYSEWLRDIQLFYDLVFPRIKKDRKKRIEIYNGLLTAALKKSNEHVKVFTGRSKDPKGVHELESSLRAIHRFLRRTIEKEGMYGTMDNEDVR